MSPSDPEPGWNAYRDLIIGLGERSVHKNYYPALRRNMADLEKLMLAVNQTTVGIMICDRHGLIEFVNPGLCAMTGYAPEELLGQKPSLLRTAETAAETYRDMWDALSAGRPWRGELLDRRKNGETYWTLLSISPVRDHSGLVTHFVGINEDVSERKQAEERQRLLIDELNHRVKNTLATVMAIAGQTLRNAASPQAFCDSFQSRLMTLSQTHDLLTGNAWTGVSLRAVVEQELTPYAEGEAQRVAVTGEPLTISPNAAVTLGMAFHELATNAAKYGALSRPGGRVGITWTLTGGAGGPGLRLEWRESGGPGVAPPARRGFGTTLLERGVSHQLGGRVHLDFAEEGLRCRIEAPLARLAAQAP